MNIRLLAALCVAVVFLSGCAGMELTKNPNGRLTVSTNDPCEGASCLLSRGSAGPFGWGDRLTDFGFDLAHLAVVQRDCAAVGDKVAVSGTQVQLCVDYDRKVRVGVIEQPGVYLRDSAGVTYSPLSDTMSVNWWRTGRDVLVVTFATLRMTHVIGPHHSSGGTVQAATGGGAPPIPPPPGP